MTVPKLVTAHRSVLIGVARRGHVAEDVTGVVNIDVDACDDNEAAVHEGTRLASFLEAHVKAALLLWAARK